MSIAWLNLVFDLSGILKRLFWEHIDGFQKTTEREIVFFSLVLNLPVFNEPETVLMFIRLLSWGISSPRNLCNDQ